MNLINIKLPMSRITMRVFPYLNGYIFLPLSMPGVACIRKGTGTSLMERRTQLSAFFVHKSMRRLKWSS